MNERITICCTSFNAKYALSTMWESYCLHNPEHPALLSVLDNGSKDGALEYAKRHAYRLLLGDNSRNHGVGLTELIRRADTEFVLTCDNDAAFVKPGAVQFMLHHLTDDAWCVCPTRPGIGKDDVIDPCRCIGYSPNIFVGLFRTAVVQKICKELDLGYAGDFTTGYVWETGGLAWRVARTHGLDSVEPPELWEYLEHYGNMSQLWCHIPNYPSLEGMNPTLPEWARDSYLERYERIKCDLAAIRGCCVEDLDEHEPRAREAPPFIETLKWGPIPHYHPFLVHGAGVR